MPRLHAPDVGVLRSVALSLAVCAGCGGAPARVTATDPEAPPVPVTIGLRLEDAGATDEGHPQTRVLLVQIREDRDVPETTDLGTFEGACDVDATPPSALFARCWWAGVSTELSVRSERGELVVERTASRDGQPAGAPEVLRRVPLPPRPRVQTLP